IHAPAVALVISQATCGIRRDSSRTIIMMMTTLAFSDSRNAWLDVTNPNSHLTNIGPAGQNLTICFLSMNRPSLSIRLLESVVTHIPNYAGRIIIADNGSDPADLNILESFLAKNYPFSFSILKYEQNLGVAKGRNRAFASAETEWILSLDNDIYLISNPLPAIARDLAELGCHFLSVPLVNADHKTFYSFGGLLAPHLDDKQASIGTTCVLPPHSEIAKAAEISPDGRGFFCSFL